MLCSCKPLQGSASWNLCSNTDTLSGQQGMYNRWTNPTRPERSAALCLALLYNEPNSIPLSCQASWKHPVSCTAQSSSSQSLHQCPRHHHHRPFSPLAVPLAAPWQHAPCDQQRRSARTACCPNQTRHMIHPAHTWRFSLEQACTVPLTAMMHRLG